MTPGALDLYELMPVVYRLRDAERREQLRALLELVGEQANLVKDDIDGMWDDLFIETCADWVVPYIGDLVSNNPIHEVAGARRADVARTIFYRRRKGTLPMLERLARDVTGWEAHAVAFFELLGWTQNPNHLRYRRAPESQLAAHQYPGAVDRVGWVNVRNLDALDRIHGPFDIVAHTADVRPIDRAEGWHGTRKVGFFVWRLRSYPLVNAHPRRAFAGDNARWRFSPLGNDIRLFNSTSRPPVADGDQVTELDVPGPIRPRAFHEHTTDYYAPGPAVSVHDGSNPVAAPDIICKDLGRWTTPPHNAVPAGKVGVDVRRGRILFAANRVPADPANNPPRVSYSYGFSADIGGGPYPREQRPRPGRRLPPRRDVDTVADPDGHDVLIRIRSTGGLGIPARTLEPVFTAIAADPLTPLWRPATRRRAVVQIEDNATYQPVGGALTITAGTSPADAQLVIQARNTQRPVVLGDITIAGTPLGRLTLNGVVIAGAVTVNGPVREVRIEHCTLVPGLGFDSAGDPAQPAAVSLSVGSSAAACTVRVEHSITGPVRLPAAQHELVVADSILHAPGGPRIAIASGAAGTGIGPVTTIERSTIFGGVRVREMRLGSESIFIGAVDCERRQQGCIRFSYLDPALPGTGTPRRYRCQPDLVVAAAPPAEKPIDADRVRPSFTSERYGHHGYAQLGLHCAGEILTGAEDGSEMGAFCSLQQPQRESNLRIRLEEYLPFGLEPGLIQVT